MRQAFENFFKGTAHNAEYKLRYGKNLTGPDTIDKVKSHWKQNGRPDGFYHRRWNTAGREVTFDGLSDKTVFVVTAISKQISAKDLVENVAFVLDLTPYQEPLVTAVSTAFIGMHFNKEGKALADKLSTLLESVGIKTTTAEAYTGGDIPDKVKQLIRENDLYFSIVTSHESNAWLLSESVFADEQGKPVIILTQDDAEFNPAILGKDRERLSFRRDHFEEDVHTQVLNKITALSEQ
jgi:hypothetical protein